MPRITGRYERTRVAGEEVAAFIPEPLPPRDPPLSLDGELASLLVRAEAALGRLDLASAGVLVETTGRRRDRTFGCAAYLDRLRAGTEV